jgi:hypothetical protein
MGREKPMTRKRRPALSAVRPAAEGRRPCRNSRCQEPFQRGDRGTVESVESLVVRIRLERDPTRLRTLLLVID